MTEAPGKAPKKEKVRKQTLEERLETQRYNRMMYGPTAGEMRPVAKKIDYGASYLKHPKFQSLLEAFRQGSSFSFSVSDKGKSYTISTDGTHLRFEGKVIYYSRPMNKYESNLLLDRSTALQYQGIEALVHLVIAVIRAFPELGTPQISFVNNEFFWGSERLEAGMAQQGPNLLIGIYRNALAKGKTKG